MTKHSGSPTDIFDAAQLPRLGMIETKAAQLTSMWEGGPKTPEPLGLFDLRVFEVDMDLSNEI